MSDDDPYFRAYAFKVGRVLSEQDVADIQQVLADHNDEIQKSADAFYEGRIAAIHEIGGDELVAAMTAKWDAEAKEVIDRIMAKHFPPSETEA